MSILKPLNRFFTRPKLNVGTKYRVASDHPFHPNREGVFEFWGGLDLDVAVLCEPHTAYNFTETKKLFCVKPESLTPARQQ